MLIGVLPDVRPEQMWIIVSCSVTMIRAFRMICIVNARNGDCHRGDISACSVFIVIFSLSSALSSAFEQGIADSRSTVLYVRLVRRDHNGLLILSCTTTSSLR